MSLTETDASSTELRAVYRRRSFATARSILALILREVSTTNGRSLGGYLWAILQPAGMIAILTLVFSIMARKPPLGTSFPIFYATGMIPFMMYGAMAGKLAASLNFSKALLVYPSVTIADALLARFILNLVTQLLVGYVIFSGILILFESRVAPDLPLIALSFAMAAAIGFGVGVMNAFLIGVLPVWRQIWSILTRPLFLISCIFFLFEMIPQPYRDWLWWNPLVHVVGLMRKGFYPYYDAPYVSLTYVFGLSLVLSVLGLIFLMRYAQDIMYS